MNLVTKHIKKTCQHGWGITEISLWCVGEHYSSEKSYLNPCHAALISAAECSAYITELLVFLVSRLKVTDYRIQMVPYIITLTVWAMCRFIAKVVLQWSSQGFLMPHFKYHKLTKTWIHYNSSHKVTWFQSVGNDVLVHDIIANCDNFGWLLVREHAMR